MKPPTLIRRRVAPLVPSTTPGFNLPPELPVNHVIAEHITRRRMIAIGTTTVLGTAGLALGTDRAGAQADVSTDGLEVQPAELAPSDGEVWAPYVQLTGSFFYRVESQPAEWQVYLLVLDGSGSGNSEAVAMTSGDATTLEGSGDYALQGPITAASFWAPADFRVADDGTARTVSVPLEIAFVVRDDAGDLLVQARAADTAVVTVAQGGVTAMLDGTGTVVGVDDQGDPTPELPEA